MEKTETSGAFFNSTLSIKFAIWFFVVVGRKSSLSIAIGVMFRVVGKRGLKKKERGVFAVRGAFEEGDHFSLTHGKR